jgi:sulfoxide reductase heme-binding subunit YedZ
LSGRAVILFKALLFFACLLPLFRLLWLYRTDGLTANPIEFITRSTGTWTLVGLLATLAVTPLRQLTRQYWLIRLRRMLGLFAFFYGCLHLTTYLWLDQFFAWGEIVKDIGMRPFITAGFFAFVLMLPLALTSTSGMVRRLGGRRWQLLHRLIYLSAIAAVVHYWWLVKADVRQPMIYAAVLSALLLYRVVKWSSQRRRGGAATSKKDAALSASP